MNEDLQDLVRLSAERQARTRATPMAEAAAREGQALSDMGAPPLDGANLYTPANAGMFNAEAPSAPPVDPMNPVQGVPLGPRAEAVADNVIGLNNGVMSPGERIGALTNKAGESMTMEFVGDEASAAVESLLPGVNYEQRRDHYRANEEQIERENPVASLAADVGGALVAPVGAISTLGQGMRLLPRMAVSGAATGAMSAGYGFMEGEGGVDDRLNEARTSGQAGAMIGAAIPAVGSGINRVANAVLRNRGTRAAIKNAPTTEQLRAMADDAYRQVDEAGVEITPQAFDRLRASMREAAEGQGFVGGMPDSNPMPGTTQNLSRADQMAASMAEESANNPAMTFRGLEQYRRTLNPTARNFNNPADQSAAVAQRAQIDDFVSTLGGADVTAGDARALQSALGRAREVWGRMRRSETMDDIFESSEGYLGGEVSGIRNRFGSILKNKRLRNQFNDEELRAMRRVVNGTIPERAIRLLGDGMGAQALGAAGAVTGAVGGATAGGLGMGALGSLGGYFAGAGVNALAHNASNAIANRNAEIARALVSSNGGANIRQLSPAVRQITEQLMRQGSAAVAQ